MKRLTGSQIRQLWLDFFKSKNHLIIPSKSLVPINDPSLLWINSGVATLKDYFSGKTIPTNNRLANAQKCIRTNDIENVGITSRHHTFFEMLGNFSIGDYFKNHAIDLAYEFLFKELKIDKKNIYVTYYDEDLETRKKWIELGINEKHIIKGNRKTNFWDVGFGPCGPCTEIFYDRGIIFDSQKIGLKLLQNDLENDRYIEIWNIVFSQFNNDGNNHYTKLKQKNIDTGAGLERIAAISQDVPTNFDSDLFLPIIKEIEKIVPKKYIINNYFIKNLEQQEINHLFRIIADHLRSSCMAIQDGVMPSNTHRGYIIRRLIRRAYRSMLLLGTKQQTFLFSLVKIVSKVLNAYQFDIDRISNVIKNEEESFSQTIIIGEKILEEKILELKGRIFPFEFAFRLFETYGFPIELTQEILQKKGFELDVSNFEKFKIMHADRSRTKKQKGMDLQIQTIQTIQDKRSNFIGYSKLECESELIFNGKENDLYYTLFDKTPFYATGGGQEHDLGTIDDNINVLDVFADKYGNNWHITNKPIEKGKHFLKVNETIRLRKARNHSATHLLNFALREFFGDVVKQVGSYNDEKKLRFDFTLNRRPSLIEIKQIENMVNQLINDNLRQECIETDLKKAKKMGALMLDGENYHDYVRVIKFGESQELCGGTHIHSTKLIEKFAITKFESKGSGIFRIEAITSNKSTNKFIIDNKNIIIKKINDVIAKNKLIDVLYKSLPTNVNQSEKELNNYLEKVKKDNKEMKKNNLLLIDLNCFSSYQEKNITIIYNEEKNAKVLKKKAIQLSNNFPDNIVFLIFKDKNKTLVVSASKKYNALEYLKNKFSSFKGGGNPRFAMGSIKNDLKTT